MKIRYKGNATVRTIMHYRWDKANGYVCDVPEELAANLLTYPRPDFELAEKDVPAAKAVIEKELLPQRTRRSTKLKEDGESRNWLRPGRNQDIERED